MGKPFLHCHHRFKNGNDHCYWSIAEKVRVAGSRWVQRHILYLGEINDQQQAAWTKVTKVFDTVSRQMTEVALFPDDRVIPTQVACGVQIRLSEFKLCRPRQWGGCWLALELWNQLQLNDFWNGLLKPSREGTPWYAILQTLVIYRLLDPGSEWRLHREWFNKSALAYLLGEDYRLAEKEIISIVVWIRPCRIGAPCFNICGADGKTCSE